MIAIYDKVQLQSSLSLIPNLCCFGHSKCHATCDWESADDIKNHEKGAKVVKDRKLEGVVDNAPIKLTELVMEKTNRPNASIQNNNITKDVITWPVAGG